MTEQLPEGTNLALAESPQDGVSIGAMRERLTIALAIHGSELTEAQRIALAEAVAKPSPVDAIVGAYDVLSEASEDCGLVLTSRAIEAADLIAAHSWHGKGDEAAAFASAERAWLAAQ